MTVYAAEFSSYFYTHGFTILSLHTTKAGAYRAVRASKLAEWEHSLGRVDWEDMEWRITPMEVQTP